MADYIDGIKIAELEELTELSEDDLFIGEDSEDTKKLTLATLIKAIPGIKNVDVYFGKSASPTKYPSLIEEETAILGKAVLGNALLGDSGEWTKDPPHLDEEEYLWARFFLTYVDGTEEWGDPWCLTDETAKNAIFSLETQLEQLKESTDADYKELKKSIENEDKKISEVETQAEDNKNNIVTINEQIEKIMNQLYPIGSVYVSINDTSPADIIGGEWESVDIGLLVTSGEDQMYMWKRIS